MKEAHGEGVSKSLHSTSSQYETKTGNLSAACLFSERKTRLELFLVIH